MSVITDILRKDKQELEAQLEDLQRDHRTAYLAVGEVKFSVVRSVIKDALSDDFGVYYVISGSSCGEFNGLTDDELCVALNDEFSFSPYREECHHEYDCCGNFYANGARIHRVNSGLVLISQGFTQNV